MRAVAVAATFGVVWAMTAPVQAANVKLMYVGQASGLNSPVRIKLNYKTYKKQAISVRLVTSSGSEVTVGTGFLNAKGVIAQAWRKVKVPGHVEAVLEAAKAL